jgi:hypothetical protein
MILPLALLAVPQLPACTAPVQRRGDRPTPVLTRPARAAQIIAVKRRVADYVPAPHEVAGWAEDPEVGAVGVEAGYTLEAILAIIDGLHDPYFKAGCRGFAKQDYRKGDFTLALYLWEMTAASGAHTMFSVDQRADETDSSLEFAPVAGVLDRAVIAQQPPSWKVYGYRSQYVYKIIGRYGEPTRAAALRPDVEAFVRRLAGGLPGVAEPAPAPDRGLRDMGK